MSRVGNKPVTVPAGIKVAISGRKIQMEGPKGKLEWEHHPLITVQLNDEGKEIAVTRSSEDRFPRSLHGLTRALIQNMVVGVKDGYEKKLEIVGVGYVGSIKGDSISLRLGMANELVRKIPAGLNVTMPDQTHIVVQGCDKQMVGQFAAEIRSLRKPEPYKGKGVRYQDEQVKLKPGKAATK